MMFIHFIRANIFKYYIIDGPSPLETWTSLLRSFFCEAFVHLSLPEVFSFFVEHSTFWCRGLEEGHDRPSNDERRWCNRSWIWGWPFYGWPIGHIIWVSLKISRTPQNLKDSHHVPLNIAIVEAHSIFHSTTSRVTLLDFPAIASSLHESIFPYPRTSSRVIYWLVRFSKCSMFHKWPASMQHHRTP